MSKEENRTRRAMGQFSAGEELATSTTIVGGQPPKRKHVTVNVPVGVERALFLAAGDRGFRAELLADRDDAVRARALPLRDSEAALLRAVPASQLEAFVDSLDVSPTNVERRAFMGAVAAGAALVAAGCSDDDGPGPHVDAGVRSDGLPLDTKGPTADAGVRDQMPVDVPQYYPDAGILPDTKPVDVPMAYPDAGVPVDVPQYYPDMGIKPDSTSD